MAIFGLNIQSLPWFIFDIHNLQLITSNGSIPEGEVADSKEIFLAETPVPGLSFNPITSGGQGNKKISLTIPIVNKKNSIGNLLILKQFENLREQSFGMSFIQPVATYQPNPQVLYYWGTSSSVPLVYYVKRCDFSSKAGLVNGYGWPQHTLVSLELWLDETSPLNQCETIFRKIASMSNSLSSILGAV